MLMQAIDTYLAIRRAMGFALTQAEGYLRNFVRFATARGDTHVVATTAIDWASLTKSEAQRHYRLQTVIRFARFMSAEDSRHEIPPHDIFCGRRQRPIPYIFSDDEIEQLMSAASRLGPPGSLRPHTYSTLFGLLAVTGMRPSEARNLHLQDVTIDGLLIRETKFHKSRLLPLHVTTRTGARPLYRPPSSICWRRSPSLRHAPRREALTNCGIGDLPSGPQGCRDSPSTQSSTPTADGSEAYLCRARP